MSNEFAENQFGLSGAAVKIYNLFRRYVNEKKDDIVFPSYEQIGKFTGLTKGSISNAIQELIKEGWISNIDKNWNGPNHYHINATKQKTNNSLFDFREKKRLKHLEKIEKTSNKDKNKGKINNKDSDKDNDGWES